MGIFHFLIHFIKVLRMKKSPALTIAIRTAIKAFIRTLVSSSSAASDVYKRQQQNRHGKKRKRNNNECKNFFNVFRHHFFFHTKQLYDSLTGAFIYFLFVSFN